MCTGSGTAECSRAVLQRLVHEYPLAGSSVSMDIRTVAMWDSGFSWMIFCAVSVKVSQLHWLPVNKYNPQVLLSKWLSCDALFEPGKQQWVLPTADWWTWLAQRHMQAGLPETPLIWWHSRPYSARSISGWRFLPDEGWQNSGSKHDHATALRPPHLQHKRWQSARFSLWCSRGRLWMLRAALHGYEPGRLEAQAAWTDKFGLHFSRKVCGEEESAHFCCWMHPRNLTEPKFHEYLQYPGRMILWGNSYLSFCLQKHSAISNPTLLSSKTTRNRHKTLMGIRGKFLKGNYGSLSDCCPEIQSHSFDQP